MKENQLYKTLAEALADSHFVIGSGKTQMVDMYAAGYGPHDELDNSGVPVDSVNVDHLQSEPKTPTPELAAQFKMNVLLHYAATVKQDIVAKKGTVQDLPITAITADVMPKVGSIEDLSNELFNIDNLGLIPEVISQAVDGGVIALNEQFKPSRDHDKENPDHVEKISQESVSQYASRFIAWWDMALKIATEDFQEGEAFGRMLSASIFALFPEGIDSDYIQSVVKTQTDQVWERAPRLDMTQEAQDRGAMVYGKFTDEQGNGVWKPVSYQLLHRLMVERYITPDEFLAAVNDSESNINLLDLIEAVAENQS